MNKKGGLKNDIFEPPFFICADRLEDVHFRMNLNPEHFPNLLLNFF
jgi:hypothetical protein